MTAMFDSCPSRCSTEMLRHVDGAGAEAEALARSIHTQYLIIGSHRTLILGLLWVKILIQLTCTLS